MNRSPKKVTCQNIQISTIPQTVLVLQNSAIVAVTQKPNTPGLLQLHIESPYSSVLGQVPEKHYFGVYFENECIPADYIYIAMTILSSGEAVYIYKQL